MSIPRQREDRQYTRFGNTPPHDATIPFTRTLTRTHRPCGRVAVAIISKTLSRSQSSVVRLGVESHTRTRSTSRSANATSCVCLRENSRVCQRVTVCVSRFLCVFCLNVCVCLCVTCVSLCRLNIYSISQ